jgi:hypothetical protein
MGARRRVRCVPTCQRDGRSGAATASVARARGAPRARRAAGSWDGVRGHEWRSPCAAQGRFKMPLARCAQAQPARLGRAGPTAVRSPAAQTTRGPALRARTSTRHSVTTTHRGSLPFLAAAAPFRRTGHARTGRCVHVVQPVSPLQRPSRCAACVRRARACGSASATSDTRHAHGCGAAACTPRERGVRLAAATRARAGHARTRSAAAVSCVSSTPRRHAARRC